MRLASGRMHRSRYLPPTTRRRRLSHVVSRVAPRSSWSCRSLVGPPPGRDRHRHRRRFLAIRRGCAVAGDRAGSAGSLANRDRRPLGALIGGLWAMVLETAAFRPSGLVETILPTDGEG